MKEDLDSAARYRQHARNLRSIAKLTRDAGVKKTLLEIANDYERLAKMRERIDKTDHNKG
jgi:hypothetical protein